MLWDDNQLSAVDTVGFNNQFQQPLLAQVVEIKL
jgi:hypothetical protein